MELEIQFSVRSKLKLHRLETYSADKMLLEIRLVEIYLDHQVLLPSVQILASVLSVRPQMPAVDFLLQISKQLLSLRRYLVPVMLADQHYLDLVQVNTRIIHFCDDEVFIKDNSLYWTLSQNIARP